MKVLLHVIGTRFLNHATPTCAILKLVKCTHTYKCAHIVHTLYLQTSKSYDSYAEFLEDILHY